MAPASKMRTRCSSCGGLQLAPCPSSASEPYQSPHGFRSGGCRSSLGDKHTAGGAMHRGHDLPRQPRRHSGPIQVVSGAGEVPAGDSPRTHRSLVADAPRLPLAHSLGPKIHGRGENEESDDRAKEAAQGLNSLSRTFPASQCVSTPSALASPPFARRVHVGRGRNALGALELRSTAGTCVLSTVPHRAKRQSGCSQTSSVKRQACSPQPTRLEGH